MAIQTRQEIYFTNNTPELQVAVLDKVKQITEDNIKLENAMGFQRAFGHLDFDGEWGFIRSEVEDVVKLSESFPEEVFTFIRFENRTIATELEDLTGRYYKCEIQNGELLAEYKPARISWVQQ